MGEKKIIELTKKTKDEVLNLGVKGINVCVGAVAGLATGGASGASIGSGVGFIAAGPVGASLGFAVGSTLGSVSGTFLGANAGNKLGTYLSKCLIEDTQKGRK